MFFPNFINHHVAPRASVNSQQPPNAAAPQPEQPAKGGPKTSAGKARSAQNSRTHGLSAKNFLLAPEEREDFQDFADSYYAEIRPEGPIENTLFRQFLESAWNLDKVQQLKAALSGPIHPFQDDEHPENAKKLERLERYRAQHQRNFNQLLKQLRDIQTNRFLRAQHDLPQDVPAIASTAAVANYLRSLRRNQADDYANGVMASLGAETAALSAKYGVRNQT